MEPKCDTHHCQCRAGYNLYTTEKMPDKKDTLNGCGPRAWDNAMPRTMKVLKSVVPDEFTKCCNAHDLCMYGYHVNDMDNMMDSKMYESEFSADECDRNMTRCMRNYIHTISITETPLKWLKIAIFDVLLNNFIHPIIDYVEGTIIWKFIGEIECRKKDPTKVCMYNKTYIQDKAVITGLNKDLREHGWSNKTRVWDGKTWVDTQIHTETLNRQKQHSLTTGLIQGLCLFIIVFSPVIALFTVPKRNVFTIIMYTIVYVSIAFAILLFKHKFTHDVTPCTYVDETGKHVPCTARNINSVQRTHQCWDVPCSFSKKQVEQLEQSIEACERNQTCDQIREALTTRNCTDVKLYI